jgi:hypothetical protein
LPEKIVEKPLYKEDKNVLDPQNILENEHYNVRIVNLHKKKAHLTPHHDLAFEKAHLEVPH